MAGFFYTWLREKSRRDRTQLNHYTTNTVERGSEFVHQKRQKLKSGYPFLNVGFLQQRSYRDVILSSIMNILAGTAFAGLVCAVFSVLVYTTYTIFKTSLDDACTSVPV